MLATALSVQLGGAVAATLIPPGRPNGHRGVANHDRNAPHRPRRSPTATWSQPHRLDQRHHPGAVSGRYEHVVLLRPGASALRCGRHHRVPGPAHPSCSGEQVVARRRRHHHGSARRCWRLGSHRRALEPVEPVRYRHGAARRTVLGVVRQSGAASGRCLASARGAVVRHGAVHPHPTAPRHRAGGGEPAAPNDAAPGADRRHPQLRPAVQLRDVRPAPHQHQGLRHHRRFRTDARCPGRTGHPAPTPHQLADRRNGAGHRGRMARPGTRTYGLGQGHCQRRHRPTRGLPSTTTQQPRFPGVRPAHTVGMLAARPAKVAPSHCPHSSTRLFIAHPRSVPPDRCRDADSQWAFRRQAHIGWTRIRWTHHTSRPGKDD